MGQGHVSFTPATPPPEGESDDEEAIVEVVQQTELGEKELFSRLEKPRVRYDVEVVTKLVVYTGKRYLRKCIADHIDVFQELLCLLLK